MAVSQGYLRWGRLRGLEAGMGVGRAGRWCWWASARERAGGQEAEARAGRDGGEGAPAGAGAWVWSLKDAGGCGRCRWGSRLHLPGRQGLVG